MILSMLSCTWFHRVPGFCCYINGNIRKYLYCAEDLSILKIAFTWGGGGVAIAAKSTKRFVTLQAISILCIFADGSDYWVRVVQPVFSCAMLAVDFHTRSFGYVDLFSKSILIYVKDSVPPIAESFKAANKTIYNSTCNLPNKTIKCHKT